MKKNSFTLIELLAVIIVLGVILTIAMPKVMGAIDSSKKQSLIISAESLIKELNKTYINDSEIAFTGKNYFITNNSFTGDKLNVTGELPDSGNLYINSDGKVALTITKGDYCVVKDFNDDKILASSNFASCILNIPEPVPESCFTYTSTATEVTITGYDYACSKNVIIPDTLGGLPVTIIGNSVFRGYNLKSVSLPIYLKTLDTWAFLQNKLVEIIIPEGVKTIGDAAFMDNSLEHIVIPNTVNSISIRTFNNNLLPDNEAFIYGRNMDGSENKTLVVSYGGAKKDNVIIPSTVERIYTYSFYSNNLNSVIFPNGLKTIDTYSFWRNNLTSVVLPNGLTSLQDLAFADNNITNHVLPNTLSSVGRGVFNDNLLPDNKAFLYARNPDGSENLSVLIGYGGANRDNVIIPSNVVTINFEAFVFSRITNVTIPNSVTTIGNLAFNGNGITSIVIPNSVTSVGTSLFQSNINFTSITLPANLNVVSNTIYPSFYDSYVTVNARAAGTYTALTPTGVWTKQP